MHQDVEIDYQLDEIIRQYFDDAVWDKVTEDMRGPILKGLSRVIRTAREYADDGTDPLDYTDFDNFEMDDATDIGLKESTF